jgi:hypothetical protein
VTLASKLAGLAVVQRFPRDIFITFTGNQDAT